MPRQISPAPCACRLQPACPSPCLLPPHRRSRPCPSPARARCAAAGSNPASFKRLIPRSVCSAAFDDAGFLWVSRRSVRGSRRPQRQHDHHLHRHRSAFSALHIRPPHARLVSTTLARARPPSAGCRPRVATSRLLPPARPPAGTGLLRHRLRAALRHQEAPAAGGCQGRREGRGRLRCQVSCHVSHATSAVHATSACTPRQLGDHAGLGVLLLPGAAVLTLASSCTVPTPDHPNALPAAIHTHRPNPAAAWTAATSSMPAPTHRRPTKPRCTAGWAPTPSCDVSAAAAATCGAAVDP